VRRKERRFGIWVNTDAPRSTPRRPSTPCPPRPLRRTVLTRPRTCATRLDPARDPGRRHRGRSGSGAFTEALIRIRTDAEGLYQLNEGAVTLRDQTLFDTSIRAAREPVEGDYRTRDLPDPGRRGGRRSVEQSITVRKVGLERWIYNLAHDRPLAYGILSLAIAIAAGWLPRRCSATSRGERRRGIEPLTALAACAGVRKDEGDQPRPT
jgi:hypothetical protein